MILGLILLLMTAAAGCAIVWPLVRYAKPARSGSDAAVYQDWLDEVERDVASVLRKGRQSANTHVRPGAIWGIRLNLDSGEAQTLAGGTA